MASKSLSFQHLRIRWGRPLMDYAKVRAFYSSRRRNKASQLDGLNLKDAYVNVGCGPNTMKGYINMDWAWQPGVDAVWDVTKGLPFADNSCQGVFTEHCLEHITFAQTQQVFCEFKRILKPGGVARIVLPNGGLYLDLYAKRKMDPSVHFPFEEDGDGKTPMVHVNANFRDHDHLFAYDAETVIVMLKKAGFQDVKEETFMSGRDSKLLIDQEHRAKESLYVEGTA